MQQIRIFIGKEDETQRLTKEVNDFLASSGAKIVNVFGNMTPQTVVERGGSDSGRIMGDSAGRRYAPSDIMMVVVYEQ